MDGHMKRFHLKILQETAENLRRNGFGTEVFETGKEAAEFIAGTVGKGKKTGFGGCMTALEMNLPEILRKNGNEVITHKPEMNMEERFETWFRAQRADFYFASPQAVTRDGKLVFIDGTGNRAASVIYGPGKVILPAGRNKIVRDLDEGYWRMREIAAIPNNIRLNKANPCVEKGYCQDCDSEERICNAVTVLLKKPKVTDYTVVLINEELGY